MYGIFMEFKKNFFFFLFFTESRDDKRSYDGQTR